MMKIAVLAFGLLAASPAMAEPLLHPMFADHAVLQRDQPIAVHTLLPGAEIAVRMGSAGVTAKAGSDGHWRANLPAMAAGGPYMLEASSGGQSQTVSDVLVGDVFLCTGQSNMQLSVRRAANGDFEIAAATDSQVRELAVDRVPSAVELAAFQTPVSWKVESPQTAGDFSASCFFFARELRKHVTVPVGLITAAWGGTRVSGWVSHHSLRAVGFNDDIEMLALYERDPKAASRRWDAAWENWWRANGRGEPWKQDALLAGGAEGAIWGPGADWPGLSLPEGSLAEPGVGFVGQMWLSTKVRLDGGAGR